MDNYIFVVFGAIFFVMVVITFVGKSVKDNLITALIVLGAVGLFALMQTYRILLVIGPWWIYVAMSLLNVLITFFTAFVYYKDPAIQYKFKAEDFIPKEEVLYVLSAYEEPSASLQRCIKSILVAVERVSHIANVLVVVVNDGSKDDTWERLQVFKDIPGIILINQNNTGKKGGLATGMLGGADWYKIFELFQEAFSQKLTARDQAYFEYQAKELNLQYHKVGYYIHTDSDSEVAPDFIEKILFGFQSDLSIGAISGHCDVLLGENPTFITQMQVAWYFTQFRLDKAAQSHYNAVICVSGPGAAFRREAIQYVLYDWVFDPAYGGGYYKGATDRKLTLEVLKGGWKVKYSESARVWTIVPKSVGELRKQWTRWKQNFWHILPQVGAFVWRLHPIASFLIYSHLIITIVGPILLSYHLIMAFIGGYETAILYVMGILLVGSLRGIPYLLKYPQDVKSGFLRPVASLFSSLWGMQLSLRALNLYLRNVFAWRDNVKQTKQKRYLYYKWFEIDPIFETRFIEVIMIIVIIIYIIRYFTGW